jgi:hypothetical protein
MQRVRHERHLVRIPGDLDLLRARENARQGRVRSGGRLLKKLSGRRDMVARAEPAGPQVGQRQ